MPVYSQTSFLTLLCFFFGNKLCYCSEYVVITYIVKKLTYLCILRKFLPTLGVESKIPDFLLHQFQHKTRLNGLCKRMNSRSVLWIDYHPSFPFLLSSQLCPRVSYIFGNILLWFPVTLQNNAKCVLDLFCCINVMTYFDIWFITAAACNVGIVKVS